MTTDQVTPTACLACPWRLANQGTAHPDGWYTQKNLSRLWARLRRGGDMSCHPTDPTVPISDKAKAAGYRIAPEHAEVRECVGAHVLKQRELMRAQDYPTPAAYRRANPLGLTREGLAAILSRAIFGSTPLDGRTMPIPDLNDPDIGHRPLGEWEARRPNDVRGRE